MPPTPHDRVHVLTTFNSGPLRGTAQLPGDKSISHRALLVGALAHGTTHVHGLNRGADVRSTWCALEALGVHIENGDDGVVVVHGSASAPDPRDRTQSSTLHDAASTLDAGNSGTTARLLLGFCTAAGLRARIDGDASLRKRPMEHAAAALRELGARIETTGGRLPATIDASDAAFAESQAPVDRSAQGLRSFTLSTPSAQLKSAFLFALLQAPCAVRIDGDLHSRDHTERMLRHFGRTLGWDGSTIVMEPGPLRAAEVHVPGDFSAAAFFIVAALVSEGSDLTLSGVGLNPTRTALVNALRTMDAQLAVDRVRDIDGEPAGDVRVRAGKLKATSLRGTLALQAADEIPAFAVAAALAQGRSEARDLRVLRTKESDRIAGIVAMLRACGLQTEEFDDGFAVIGGNPKPPTQPIETFGDHRLAMAAAALAAAAGTLTVDDGACIGTSFPGFSESWSAVQRTPHAAL